MLLLSYVFSLAFLLADAEDNPNPASSQNTNEVHILVPGVATFRCKKRESGVVEALGIRYAAPPTGSRRFRPPESLVPGTVDTKLAATKFGSPCLQRTAGGFIGDEDCLYLNIYVPPSVLPRPHGGWPVLFWMHGGAFAAGSGQLYNGTKLAEKGVMVVTINYRLGMLGFAPLDGIAAENPQAPSNGGIHGLMDQALALQWVHDHIDAFGGNAAQVTIAGESAGAVCVEMHLRLPLMRGLYKRAIIQSGWHFGLMFDVPDGMMNVTVTDDLVKTITTRLNVSELEGLRKVEATDLLDYGRWPQRDSYYMTQMPMHMPIVCSGCEVIIGSNSYDSIIGPGMIDISMVTSIPSTTVRYRELLESYFGAEVFEYFPVPHDNSTKDEVLVASFRAGVSMGHTCSTRMLGQELQTQGHTTYMYHFMYWPSDDAWRGMALHTAELPYVFDYKLQEFPYILRYYSEDLAAQLSGYWSNFIRTGVPLGSISWRAFSSSTSHSVLQISQNANNSLRVMNSMEEDSAICDYVGRFISASSANLQNWYSFIHSISLGMPNAPAQRPTRVPALARAKLV